MITKICFVGLDNYIMLNPYIKNEYVGGESVQHFLLAKEFSTLGYEVSMIVKDYGQENGEMIDNIKVWKTFKDRTGLPIIQFLHPTITSIIAALKKADADLYYQSCAGIVTGLVAWFCRRHKKRFIFRTASDTDCIVGQQLIKYARDRKIYEYGLRRADIIAVQGINQQRLLWDNYHLDSIPVNLVVEPPRTEISLTKDIDVLWINNFRPLKRPELFFDIALMLPKYQFVMIGGPITGSEHYYYKNSAKSQNINNLEFVGPVPYSAVNKYFARAKVFVNTSEVEGFPNSFLQAWIHGVPVVSFLDPDELIAKNELGFIPVDLEDMVNHIDNLIQHNNQRIYMSSIARKFAAENYSPINIAEKYIKLLEDKVR